MKLETPCEPFSCRPERHWVRRPENDLNAWVVVNDIRPSGWIGEPEFVGRNQNKTVPERFARLSERWKLETINMSSISQLILHDAYQQIIGMGSAALPYIFQSLSHEPRYWFPALEAITGENPVDPIDIGDVRVMRNAWLQWAVDHGFSISW